MSLSSVFFVGNSVDGISLRRRRNGRHEKRMIVTAHTGMTPHDLEKENQTEIITSCLRSRHVLFTLAAVGAIVKPILRTLFPHYFPFCWSSCRSDSNNSIACCSLWSVCSDTNCTACSTVSFATAGEQYGCFLASESHCTNLSTSVIVSLP